MNRPEDATDEQIHALFGDDLSLERHTAEVIKRIETLMKPRIRRMEYDHVPVGHDMGYRCYDAGKHNGSHEAFLAGEYGDGLSENEAYAAWLSAVDETPIKPRASRVIFSSQYEPPEYADDRRDEHED